MARKPKDSRICVVVRPDASAFPVTVTIAQLRKVLDEAGVHWGRMNLRGRCVVVTTRGTRTPSTSASEDQPRAPMQDDASDEVVANAPLVSSTTPPGTKSAATLRTEDPERIRGDIARRIAEGLGESPDDIALGFRSRDADWLDRDARHESIRIDLNFDRPRDTMRITLTLVESGRSKTVPVDVYVRSNTLRPIAAIPPGTSVDAAHFEEIVTWQPWSVAAKAPTLKTIGGHIATRSLVPGKSIEARDFVRPTIVERGKPVTLHCLVGGAVISMPAKAREDGRKGDVIDVVHIHDRVPLRARVIAEGEVMLERANPVLAADRR